MVTRIQHDFICAQWHWCGISILMELELAQKILQGYLHLPISMALAIITIGFTRKLIASSMNGRQTLQNG